MPARLLLVLTELHLGRGPLLLFSWGECERFLSVCVYEAWLVCFAILGASFPVCKWEILFWDNKRRACVCGWQFLLLFPHPRDWNRQTHTWQPRSRTGSMQERLELHLNIHHWFIFHFFAPPPIFHVANAFGSK